MSSTRAESERVVREARRVNTEWAEMVNAIDKALQARDERLIRVLGIPEVEALAHHAIGVWQAFEDSPLFANTKENWQRARDAVEDARTIRETCAAIRKAER